MQVFSGSSNRELAGRIAEVMGLTLGLSESTKFPNGEARIAIKEKKSNGEALLVQSLSMPVDEHIVEFCLLADAINRHGTPNLVGVVPWFGYSKQDKIFIPGEPLSAKVVAQILQTTKMKKLITFDLHNRAILGFFDIPVVELSAKPMFVEYFKQKVNKNTVVVAPDAGSVKSSSSLARELGVPIVYMDKIRDLKTGKVDVMGMTGSVAGREVIIVDDLIVTGSTMISTAKYLKEKGAAKVSVSATHHLYVPGVQEKLEDSEIDEIVVTDTVQCTNAKMHEFTNGKLKILSVAKLIVDELQ